MRYEINRFLDEWNKGSIFTGNWVYVCYKSYLTNARLGRRVRVYNGENKNVPNPGMFFSVVIDDKEYIYEASQIYTSKTNASHCLGFSLNKRKMERDFFDGPPPPKLKINIFKKLILKILLKKDELIKLYGSK